MYQYGGTVLVNLNYIEENNGTVDNNTGTVKKGNEDLTFIICGTALTPPTGNDSLIGASGRLSIWDGSGKDSFMSGYFSSDSSFYGTAVSDELTNSAIIAMQNYLNGIQQ